MRTLSLTGLLFLAALRVSLAQYTPPGIERFDGEILTETGAESLQSGVVTGARIRQSGRSGSEAAADFLPQAAKDTAAALEKSLLDPDSRTRPRTYLNRLLALQDSSTRANKLEEAEAIRDCIEVCQARIAGALPDPGSLTAYRGQTGQSFLFFVMGRQAGTIWGTGIYTDDSMLGVAVVHAGLLHEKEKGVVRVTILDGQPQYEASAQNGVSSNAYAVWQGSYRVELCSLSTDRRRDYLPRRAREIVNALNRNKNAADYAEQAQKSAEMLTALQKSYAAAGRLDEALALRAEAQKLLAPAVTQTEMDRAGAWSGQDGKVYNTR